MRHQFTLILAAICLALNAACTSPAAPPGQPRGPALSRARRYATRVDVDARGRPALDGRSMSVPALARRLKSQGANSAVALHGAKGCSMETLVRLRDALVDSGLPRVTIVTPRKTIVSEGERTLPAVGPEP